MPLYDELCEKAEDRRRFVREYSKSLLQSLEKPFNFWLRERARAATGEVPDALRRHHHWYSYSARSSLVEFTCILLLKCSNGESERLCSTA